MAECNIITGINVNNSKNAIFKCLKIVSVKNCRNFANENMRVSLPDNEL